MLNSLPKRSQLSMQPVTEGGATQQGASPLSSLTSTLLCSFEGSSGHCIEALAEGLYLSKHVHSKEADEGKRGRPCLWPWPLSGVVLCMTTQSSCPSAAV